MRISIGISAYNEESNIGNLLEELLAQGQESIKIRDFIVVSDGSDDRTAEKAREFASRGVTVIDDGVRKGKSKRLNEILNRCPDADVLVFFDADIAIRDRSLLEKMSKEIAGGADLVSVRMLPLEKNCGFAQFIAVSYLFKDDLFGRIRKGRNVYTSHGTSRALSAKMIRSFRFRESVGEDAYLYLFCIQNGMKYSYLDTTEVFVGVPCNLRDHKKQSDRFYFSKEMFFRDFGRNEVIGEYRIPTALFARTLVKWFMLHPIAMTGYMSMMLALRLARPKSDVAADRWEMAESTKRRSRQSNGG